MAKRNRKETEPTQAHGDAEEQPAADAAAAEFDFPPREPEQVKSDERSTAQAEPAAPQPAVRKLHSVLTRKFDDRRVELIDDGNAGGLGIKLTYDDPNERPSEAVKQILKEGDDQRPGYSYHRELKQWRKRIGRDADPRTAVAIRLDAERRVDAIGEQMSHEEQLKAERERADNPAARTPA
jgi:hypothetical protein